MIPILYTHIYIYIPWYSHFIPIIHTQFVPLIPIIYIYIPIIYSHTRGVGQPPTSFLIHPIEISHTLGGGRHSGGHHQWQRRGLSWGRTSSLSPWWLLQNVVSGKGLGTIVRNYIYGKIHHFEWESQLFLWQCSIIMFKKLSGWWFGTWILFHSVGNNDPNWLSYFSEG